MTCILPLRELVLSVSILLGFLFLCLRILPGQPMFPPGPPSKPVVGNILRVPAKATWRYFSQLHHKYGELLFFHGLGSNILVLSTMDSITDLFEKRGENYSHRPLLAVLGELMGLDRSMPMLPYGKEWREQRKLAHFALKPTMVKKYCPVQEDLASVMVLSILDNPADFFAHVRLYAERIILSITYGLSIDVADNEYVTHAENTMHMIGEAMVPGAFLCDFLPWMKHLPSWLSFQKDAAHGRNMIEHLVLKPFEHVKKEMAQAVAPPSLTHDLLSLAPETTALYEHRVQWSAGSMYGAGGETTYATVLTFMMAMAMNPDKQKLAQAEIDEVVGTDRLPVISDLPKLCYTNAVIKETMRWHPALPLGIARRTDHDDIYRGYFVPRNTIVLPNIWEISQQPSKKYDSGSFIPERFLDPSEIVIDPSTYAFGFGRRICPGKALAENSVFIAIAGILASFDITQPDGAPLEPKFGSALVSYPEPFKCNIRPRSDEKCSMVRRRGVQVHI